MANWATSGAASGARAGWWAVAVAMALLVQACAGNPPPNSNAGTGAFGLPTGVIGGADVSGKDAAANGDTAPGKDSAAAGQDGGSGDGTAVGPDGGATDQADTIAGSDGTGEPKDGTVAEDSALVDQPELDSEPGTEEDAEGTDEDTLTPPLDIKDAKTDIKDDGEDPNNPWYNTPLPDEYIGADTPDASGPSDTSGQSLPPICTPVIGSVSVKETVGLGGKIDVIVWVDTSGSMVAESAWVSSNLSKFAGFLESKKIDYHLVLVGITQGSVKLCVEPPMGTGMPNCNSTNINTFITVKKPIQSTDGLKQLVNTVYYNEFKLFLRPDAATNIIAVTDDNSSLSAVDFKAKWAALQSANQKSPNFIYHSICAFNYLADGVTVGPKSAGMCNTGAAYGEQHIALAKSTGGTLYQVCKSDWTSIFDGLSKAVAATAKPVCTYKLPLAAGKTVTWKNVKVSHIENQVVAPLLLINGESGCANSPNGWYYDDPLKPTTATLCEATCKKLVGGAVTFNFGCPQTQLPSKTP